MPPLGGGQAEDQRVSYSATIQYCRMGAGRPLPRRPCLDLSCLRMLHFYWKSVSTPSHSRPQISSLVGLFSMDMGGGSFCRRVRSANSRSPTSAHVGGLEASYNTHLLLWNLASVRYHHQCITSGGTKISFSSYISHYPLLYLLGSTRIIIDYLPTYQEELFCI